MFIQLSLRFALASCRPWFKLGAHNCLPAFCLAKIFKAFEKARSPISPIRVNYLGACVRKGCTRELEFANPRRISNDENHANVSVAANKSFSALLDR